MSKKGKSKHTTRAVHLKLPKYVQYFPNSKSKNKFRVVRKIDGKVRTFGYYSTVEECVSAIRSLGWYKEDDQHPKGIPPEDI